LANSLDVIEAHRISKIDVEQQDKAAALTIKLSGARCIEVSLIH
jgi:hypothetical protein